MLCRYLLAINFVFCFFVFSQNSIQAEDFKLCRNGPVNNTSYIYSLLSKAISRLNADHTVSGINSSNDPRQRLLRDIATGVSDCNITPGGAGGLSNQDFIAVPIPIYRGLLGYRALVIRPGEQERFDHLNTLEDIKKNLTLGSGRNWKDSLIFEKNGFNVVPVPSPQLNNMLIRKRFDAYHYGIIEIWKKLSLLGENTEVAENNIILKYPFASFFYIPKRLKGHYEILYASLKDMYADGTFVSHFMSHSEIQQGLKKGKLNERLIFEIENPFSGEFLKSLPSEYWYTPVIEKPSTENPNHKKTQPK